MKDDKTMKRGVGLAVSAVMVLALAMAPELALAGTGAPWETAFCTIIRSISGPIASGLAIGATILCGTLLMFGEAGGMMKTLMGVVFGAGIAVTAVNLVTFFYPAAVTCV